jgi:hypothetical protein
MNAKKPNLMEVFLWCKRNVTPNQAAKIISLMRRLGSYHVEGLDKERDALHNATIEFWNELSESDGDQSLKTTINTHRQPLRTVLSRALGIDMGNIGLHIADTLSQKEYKILVEKCGYEYCMNFANESALDFINEFSMIDEENWSFDELEWSVNQSVALMPGDAVSKHTNAKDLCEKFGLRDIRCVAESEDVWQKTLDHLNDALANLANSIGLKESDFKSIGFYGKLRLNIGSCLENQRAICLTGTQEDKEEVVIALDVRTGWGTIAHEWWHACDFVLGAAARKMSGGIDNCTMFTEFIAMGGKTNQATALSQAMLDVIAAINEKAGGNKEKIQIQWNDEMEIIKSHYFEQRILPKAREKRNYVAAQMNEWLESLHSGIKIEDAMNGFQKIVDVFPSAVKYEPYIRTELECAISNVEKIEKGHNESIFKCFARRVSELAQDGCEYSIIEMSARSFESSFIDPHLSKNNIATRSLSDMKHESRFYPQGEERVNQNRAWKSMMPHIIDALKRPSELTSKMP